MRAAINGFGRIGRQVLRLGLSSKALQFVAINDLNPSEILAHLFKYDSVHPTFEGEVKGQQGSLTIHQQKISVLAKSEISALPWKDLKVDLVLECTGRFNSREEASKHLGQGAKKVLVSAPCSDADLTVVMGVNEDQLDLKKHHLISNASCTTNCVAIVLKVLLKHFGIERAFMTTVHSYTNDQRILDLPHKDFRRARAAALSIIPTSSGGTKTIVKIFPELKDRFDGLSIRVPTPDVSLIDVVAELKKGVTLKDVNEAFKEEAHGRLEPYLGYSEEPLVSSDYIGNSKSAIFDAPLTQVLDKKWVKVLAWYDNETGFSARMIDLASYLYGR